MSVGDKNTCNRNCQHCLSRWNSFGRSNSLHRNQQYRIDAERQYRNDSVAIIAEQQHVYKYHRCNQLDLYGHQFDGHHLFQGGCHQWRMRICEQHNCHSNGKSGIGEWKHIRRSHGLYRHQQHHFNAERLYRNDPMAILRGQFNFQQHPRRNGRNLYCYQPYRNEILQGDRNEWCLCFCNQFIGDHDGKSCFHRWNSDRRRSSLHRNK